MARQHSDESALAINLGSVLTAVKAAGAPPDGGGLRPALTAALRGASGNIGRDGETALLRPNRETLGKEAFLPLHLGSRLKNEGMASASVEQGDIQL